MIGEEEGEEVEEEEEEEEEVEEMGVNIFKGIINTVSALVHFKRSIDGHIGEGLSIIPVGI